MLYCISIEASHKVNKNILIFGKSCLVNKNYLYSSLIVVKSIIKKIESYIKVHINLFAFVFLHI